MTTLSAEEYRLHDRLDFYRYGVLLEAKKLTAHEKQLNAQGLLSIRPHDRTLVRVKTTDAGMEMLREIEAGK